ncbi:uncharacterized protein LOC123308322 [Coccinella septempunctata]|uniref:uncharacterized protein LOC123308322 n=1 Tax=Coccinella septempunctata TaxID=41139 RepID=UPI001D096214|nr:uncharacterized protein LOC123308322 [Coccinella septempunctata]
MVVFYLDGMKALSYDPFKKTYYGIRGFMDYVGESEKFASNLQGHKLQLALFLNPPRIIKEDTGKWHSDDEFFWQRIIHDLNGTIEIVETTPYDLDAAKMAVRNGKAHFCPLSYFRTSIPENLDFIAPHAIEDLVVLVPYSELIPQSTYILMVFSTTVWFYLFFSIILFLVLLLVMNKMRKSHKRETSSIVMDIISLLLGKSITIHPYYNNWLEKGYLCLSQMISIVIITAFNSALISAVLVDKHKGQINTLSDLKESQLSIYALPDLKYYVEEFAPMFKSQLVKIPRRNYSSLLENKIHQQALVVPRSLSQAALDMINDKGSNVSHRTMRESLLSGFSTYFFTKGSPFVKIIDKMILKKFQYGLDWKDLREFDVTPSEFTAKKRHIPLSLSHLGGIFVVWLVGVGISIIVFFAERFHILTY